MLDILQISKTFNPGTINEKKALNALSLNLKEGDFVTVIGGNGAGKSTLLKISTSTLSLDNLSVFLDLQVQEKPVLLTSSLVYMK